MARPLKQGLSYFPHDTDAVNDEKIQALMALYGAEGYAFYFVLLERIFRTENGRITCGEPAIIAGLAKQMCITTARFTEILSTALNIGCFNPVIYQNDKVLTSGGIEKRLLSVNKLRDYDRHRKDLNTKKGNIKGKGKGKLKRENLRKTNVFLTENSNPLILEDKKDEKTKQIYGEFKNVRLNNDEMEKLNVRFGKEDTIARIENLSGYIASKGDKYKSHYATILQWAKKDIIPNQQKKESLCYKCKKTLNDVGYLKDTPKGSICSDCE